MGDLSAAQKWQLICMYQLQRAARRRAEADEEEGGGDGFLGAMLQDDDDLGRCVAVHSVLLTMRLRRRASERERESTCSLR